MAHLGRFMLRTAVDALIRQDNELAASVVARKEEIHLKWKSVLRSTVTSLSP